MCGLSSHSSVAAGLGESARAARLYLELLKRLPEAGAVRERVRANLTDIYLRGSDQKLAVEQLEAMIRDDPTNPQAYFFLGRLALPGLNQNMG